MIDRGSIARRIRDFYVEVNGFGFSKGEPLLLEQVNGTSKQVTARASAKHYHRVPKARIQQLSREARLCNSILSHVEEVDRRYFVAMIYYVAFRNLNQGARAMQRSVGDFSRFAEAGFGIFASCLARQH